MCGGTWPPFHGETKTRPDNQFPLDGTDNLIDAPPAELQGAINELYRPEDQIPGGTAGAVRRELATGERVGGKTHLIKATERMRQLTRILNSGRLSAHDAEVARALIQYLSDALAGK